MSNLARWRDGCPRNDEPAFGIVGGVVVVAAASALAYANATGGLGMVASGCRSAEDVLLGAATFAPLGRACTNSQDRESERMAEALQYQALNAL